MQLIKINKIKPNPSNPRVIKDNKFQQLKKSLEDFPDMAKVRPIVVNSDMVVLGGNMRLKAMQAAGWKDVPVEVVDWPEERQREFIIKDNVGFGEWDWELIAHDWPEAGEWGLDLPGFDVPDYSDKNQEIDVNGMDDEMIIKLKYTEDDYNIVKGQLMKLAATPEQAVWKLLGNE
jgi:hypothetical protein